MEHMTPVKGEQHPHQDGAAEQDKRDLVTPVANVAMTPFSVIASTCLQVTLGSNSGDGTEDKSFAFNLVSACIIATAGMLMAVFLVTTNSCSVSKQRPPREESWVVDKVKRLLLIDQPPIDDKERLRIARMMLRCLWFSLSYMTIGFLCKVLKHQLHLSDPVNGVIAVIVWIIFIWSSFGAPLPEFNGCLRKVGSVFTTAFPLILMAAYTAVFLTAVS